MLPCSNNFAIWEKKLLMQNKFTCHGYIIIQHFPCYPPAISLIWEQEKSNTFRMTEKKDENNWVFVDTIGCQQIKFQLNTKLAQFLMTFLQISYMQLLICMLFKLFWCFLLFQLRTSDCMYEPLVLACPGSFLMTWPYWQYYFWDVEDLHLTSEFYNLWSKV